MGFKATYEAVRSKEILAIDIDRDEFVEDALGFRVLDASGEDFIEAHLVHRFGARLEQLIADAHRTVDVLVVAKEILDLDELHFHLPARHAR